MPAVTPLPTLSQLRQWDTEHLSQAADNWAAQAHQLESTFEQHYQRLAATDWKGQGRDGHVARAGLDLVKVRRPVGQLREAASAARYGFDQQNGAKESVLDAVADAQAAGFEVNEDLSVDGWFTGTEQEFAAACARAQALSAQIRHRAALLVASNQEIATKITAAAGSIGEFSFDEPTGTGERQPSDNKSNGAVQPVDRPLANQSALWSSDTVEQRAVPTAHVQNAAWMSPSTPAASTPSTPRAALVDGGPVQHLLSPSPVSPTPPASPAPSGGAVPGTGVAASAGGSLPRVGGGAGGGTAGLAPGAAWPGPGVAGTSALASRPGISGAANIISAPAAAVGQAVPAAAVVVHPHEALVSPQPASPQPPEPPSAQSPSPGEAQHEQAPHAPPSNPPPPNTSLPPTEQLLTAPPPAPPEPANPPAAPQPGPLAPSPSAGGAGIQMLGTGLSGVPKTPPIPIPLDPTPPALPPIEDMTKEQAIAAWDAVNADIADWNNRCGVEIRGPFQLPSEQAAYDACIASKGPLLERQAAIEARLKDLGVPIEGEGPVSSGEEPAPSVKEEPPFSPPGQINGYTSHGRESADDHDGHGVNDSALQDAVEHPLEPPSYEVDEQGRGAYLYEGKDATVVLNKDGQVVTTWANSHHGWRH